MSNIKSIAYYRRIKAFKDLLKQLKTMANQDDEQDEIQRLKEYVEDQGYVWEDIDR